MAVKCGGHCRGACGRMMLEHSKSGDGMISREYAGCSHFIRSRCKSIFRMSASQGQT